MDYWIWSVSLSSIGSTLTGIKFAATIYRNRAPGMALCRYLTRPALAEGRVRYTLKTPYRDGATRVVCAPLDCMARAQRLAGRDQAGPAGEGAKAVDTRTPTERHRATLHLRGCAVRETGVPAELQGRVVDGGSAGSAGRGVNGHGQPGTRCQAWALFSLSSHR